MARRALKCIALLLILGGIGCVKEATTSPAFEYAGEWRGTWIDYNFFNPSTGHPVRSYNLVLTVKKDGAATGEGDIRITFVEGLFVDRLKMWMDVLPDGSAYGIGTWDVRLGSIPLASEEGKVVGQFDAETGKGGGSFMLDGGTYVWHFPWQVNKSK